MNINDMFPSRYLKGADLKGPVTVTISRVVGEKMYKPGEGQASGYVLYCEKASKGLVLSWTLANQIAQALCDPDTDKWIGRQVTLYGETMQVAGVQCVAIRARSAHNGSSDK